MSIEIERKFLIQKPTFQLSELEFINIKQGYICIESQTGNVVRIRKSNNDYFLTIKSKGDQSRIEVENPISKIDFDSLWGIVHNRSVTKKRYLLPYKNHLIEIDEYMGRLNGLWTAEIEFESTSDAETFETPNWLAKEVTVDKRFKNHSLALLTNPNEVTSLYDLYF